MRFKSILISLIGLLASLASSALADKLQILAGATSQTINVYLQDSTSTTGAAKTGLAYTDITVYYEFPKTASTSITTATLAAATSSYSSGGFKEIDATHMAGWYRFDLPNAAIASGNGRYVSLLLTASGTIPCPVEIELTGIDNQNAASNGITDLDATISSRMATYTQPTGFLAATFPGTVASTTNITAATGITVATNSDKTGYSLSQSFPTNFASLSIDGSGRTLLQPTQTGVTIPTVTTVGTLTTYTGNTPQTGDAFSRIGSAGAGLTALGDAHIAHLDADVSSRMATFTLPTRFSSLLIDVSGDVTFNNSTVGLSGDFTSTMKTSLNAATPASIQGSIGGNVAGDVQGNLAGHIGGISGITFPTRFSSLAIDASGFITYNNAAPPTAAQNAAAALGDTTDLATHGSLGWMTTQWLNDQVSPTASTSALTTAVLANAPGGGGSVTVNLPQPAPAGYGVSTVAGNVPTTPFLGNNNQTFTAFANYTLYQPIQQNGQVSSGWTQFLFTVSTIPAQGNGAVVLQDQISSPAQGTDGMSKGPAGGSGSITVNAVTPSTVITVNNSPAAMNLTPGKYRWEETVFIGSAKHLLGYGTMVISPVNAGAPNSNP